MKKKIVLFYVEDGTIRLKEYNNTSFIGSFRRLVFIYGYTFFNIKKTWEKFNLNII